LSAGRPGTGFRTLNSLGRGEVCPEGRFGTDFRILGRALPPRRASPPPPSSSRPPSGGLTRRNWALGGASRRLWRRRTYPETWHLISRGPGDPPPVRLLLLGSWRPSPFLSVLLTWDPRQARSPVSIVHLCDDQQLKCILTT
jgi:hypothetical protein